MRYLVTADVIRITKQNTLPGNPSEEYLRKGLEFYSQQAWRLNEEWFRQSLQECDLVIVEGQNDVLNLAHEEKLAAISAMSNRLTEEQILKALDFASKVSEEKSP